jgi:hypothetical protein
MHSFMNYKRWISKLKGGRKPACLVHPLFFLSLALSLFSKIQISEQKGNISMDTNNKC